MSSYHYLKKSIVLTPNQFNRFELRRNFFKRFGFKKKLTQGYYVLFPDIPKDTKETNEVLNIPTDDSTPQFTKINVEKCVKAVGKLSIEFESCIDSIEHRFDEKTLGTNLDDVIKPIEKCLVPLNYALTTLRSLRSVDQSKYDFKKFDSFYDRINKVKSRRFQSQQIYYFMREINSDRNKLNKEQKRIVDKYLLEAKLFGTHLPDKDVHNLNTIHEKLNEHKTIYRRKLDEATKRFAHTIDDPALLQVLPDELIAAIGSHSYATVTLHSSVFNPFMEYCPDRLVRWNLWMAYNSRASPAIDSKLSNSTDIEEIRGLRRKQAQCLGYDNYVELSMETKMAKNVENVKALISTLHTKSKPMFDNTLKELTDFARQIGNLDVERLELWDMPYWQRKLLKSKYSIEDSLIKQYFPLDTVLKGMFQLCEQLFSIRIEEVMSGQYDAWHRDVKLYRILSENGIIGSFFFDPYTRINSKSRGIWNDYPLSNCDSLRTKPISYCIMNLPKPLIEGQSIQLSFAQVLNLFKQFGAVLQHCLSEVISTEISSFSNLEWDVVYLSPEFLALWPLHSFKVISSCSSHVIHKTPIPEQEFDRIRQAHYHFSCFNLKHEVYRIALDLALYSNDQFWTEITTEIWKQYMSPFKMDKSDTHPCSFRAIFCGDHAASYFSFKWAEMLAADAFGSFLDAGLDDDESLSAMGLRFRKTFLALGGGSNSNEIFRRFLGRDPSPDAYLKINGLFGSIKRRDFSGPEKISATGSENL